VPDFYFNLFILGTTICCLNSNFVDIWWKKRRTKGQRPLPTYNNQVAHVSIEFWIFYFLAAVFWNTTGHGNCLNAVETQGYCCSQKVVHAYFALICFTPTKAIYYSDIAPMLVLVLFPAYFVSIWRSGFEYELVGAILHLLVQLPELCPQLLFPFAWVDSRPSIKVFTGLYLP